ncbi:DinB family protein [bacterium]|nr:MAG: DinB family protein [bacterium]
MMLVHHAGARSYLFSALNSSPDLVSHLLQGITEEEADFLAAPDRFSIREIVAHLADWDSIFLGRMKQTVEENMPTIREYDEGERALELDYAHSNVAEQLRLFHQSRAQMNEFLRGLTPEQWERVCFHPRIGHMTVEALVTLVPLHDSYHLRQIMDWRKAFTVYQSVLD